MGQREGAPLERQWGETLELWRGAPLVKKLVSPLYLGLVWEPWLGPPLELWQAWVPHLGEVQSGGSATPQWGPR